MTTDRFAHRSRRPAGAPILALVSLLGGASLASAQSIEITSPENGAFIETPSVLIEGQVSGVSLPSVTVRGDEVVQPVAGDGSFGYERLVDAEGGLIFEDTIVRLENNADNALLDRDRVVLVPVLSPPTPDGELDAESIAIRVNDPGLDKLEGLASSLVDLDEIAAEYPPGTVIYDDCFLEILDECIAGAVVTVDTPAPSIASVSLSLDSRTDLIHVDGVVNGFEVNIDVDGDDLIPDCELNVRAQSVSISLDLASEPDASQPGRIDVSQLGGATGLVSGFQVTGTGGACDDPIIGDLLEDAIEDVLDEELEEALEDFLNDVDADGNTKVAEALEEALAGLDLSGEAGDFLLDAPLADVVEDGSGFLVVADFGATDLEGECSPLPGTPVPTASYPGNTFLPFYGPLSPQGAPYDFAIGLSPNVFNQVFKAALACGTLSDSISTLDVGGGERPITSGLIGILIPAFFSIGPNVPLEIQLVGRVAPVTNGVAGQSGAPLPIELADLAIRFVETGGRAPGTVWLDVAIDMSFEIEIGVGGGTLRPRVLPIPPESIRIFVGENPIGANESGIEALLPFVVSAAVEPLIEDVVDEIPLPEIEGLFLEVLEVNGAGNFFSLFLTLIEPVFVDDFESGNGDAWDASVGL